MYNFRAWWPPGCGTVQLGIFRRGHRIPSHQARFLVLARVTGHSKEFVIALAEGAKSVRIGNPIMSDSKSLRKRDSLARRARSVFFFFSHIAEVDRDAMIRWIAVTFEPGVQRFRIEVVEVARYPSFYSPAVLPAKLRLRCMRKELPLRSANHLFRPQSNDPRRLVVHVGVPALLVQNHQAIGRALQHVL